MGTRIVTEIDNCSQCKFQDSRNHWSSDGWDRMEDWFCTKTDPDRKIQGGVEWHDKVPVPDWCPLRVAEIGFKID